MVTKPVALISCVTTPFSPEVHAFRPNERLAWFGYDNANSPEVTLPAGGPLNYFDPPAAHRGQPSVFPAIKDRFAFSVRYDVAELAWWLQGVKKTAREVNCPSFTPFTIDSDLPIRVYTGASAGVVETAQTLSTQLERITGHQHPVLQGPRPGGISVGKAGDFIGWEWPYTANIFVPESPYGGQDYIVATHGDRISLAGATDAGVRHAVFEFLYQLGYRPYVPGESSEVVPHLPVIEDLMLDIQRRPTSCSGANGTPCDDGDVCTRTDTCVEGVCFGSNAVTCLATGPCHGAGSCNPHTGCSDPVLPDGTACDPDGQGLAFCELGSCVPADGICEHRTEHERWSSPPVQWPADGQWVGGDFNGDELPDMAVAYRSIDGQVAIDVYQNQQGSFFLDPWPRAAVWPEEGRWLAGDFDGDGTSDMLSVSNDGGAVRLTLYDGETKLGADAGRWDNFPIFFWRDESRWATGHFNDDEWLDVVVAFEDSIFGTTGPVGIHVYVNLGGQVFVPMVKTVPHRSWPAGSQWVVGPFNDDSLTDLGMAFNDGGHVSIEIFRNLDNQEFAIEDWAVKIRPWRDTSQFVVGDFNDDLRLDIAQPFRDESFAASIDGYLNRGTSFAAERLALYDGPWAGPAAWVAGNFDEEQADDLAVAFWNGGTATDLHKMGSYFRSCAPEFSTNAITVIEDSELGGVESEGIQGIAANAEHWYWFGTDAIERVSIVDLEGTPSARTEIPLVLAQEGYDHFGDGDVFQNRVYVPLIRTNTPPSLIPALAVFDLDLNFMGWGRMSDGGAFFAAVNPKDGLVYSSGGNGGYQRISGYHPLSLEGNNGGQLAPFRRIDLSFAPQFIGDPPLPSSAQGGAFSPNGIFYYVYDHTESGPHGIHVFEVPTGTGDAVAPQLLVNENFTGFLSAPLPQPENVFGLRADEHEGATVFLDSTGQLHVYLAMLTNELDDDDVTLFRFGVDELIP